ncbi:MAG: hypothetical protein MUF49_20700 [Oculatellaceae cyanobacterium Prado106]|nr:hypothetical protein [Oculatellaceae cyanobacterium Prado106]
MRGGSWNNNPRNCRSANRNRNTPDNHNRNIGFRVVLFAASAPAVRTGQWKLIGRTGRVQTCSCDGRDSIQKSTGFRQFGKICLKNCLDLKNF